MMAGQECAEVVCLVIRLSFIQCSDRLAVQAPAGSGRQYQASEYQQSTQQMEQAEVFPEENNRQYRGINRRKVHENGRSEEHTSELQSRPHLVCRLLLEKKKKKAKRQHIKQKK